MLAGGGAAAVAAAGARVGERLSTPGTADRHLVPDSAAWVDVAALAHLPEGTACRFSTASFEGVLVNRGGSIDAMSAACTHLGCILHVNAAARHRPRRTHGVGYTMRYTLGMSKVMISLPEDLLRRLDSEARRRSMSRSGLLAAALQRELARRDPDEMAAAIARSELRFRAAESFEAADVVRADRDTGH